MFVVDKQEAEDKPLFVAVLSVKLSSGARIQNEEAASRFTDLEMLLNMLVHRHTPHTFKLIYRHSRVTLVRT